MPATADGLVYEGLEALEPDGAPFDVLARLMAQDRVEVLNRLRASGLSGRGGGHFPAARKWDAVLIRPGPRVLIVNAQEGEPDTHKDRAIAERQSEVAVVGVAIAAHVISAAEVHVVCDPAAPEARAGLERGLAALAVAHPRIAERVRIVDGPGLYVCGEETALLAYLEGERGEPRIRPPHPSEAGLRGRPTLVHNLETLAWLPRLLEVDGRRAAALVRLVSVSGAVRAPGVYGVERDEPLRAVLARAGGTPDGAPPLAFAVGGPTGQLVPAGDALEWRADSLPGTGSVRVVGAAGCPVTEALRAARFAAAETCGRCTPCRVGTVELERLLGRLAAGDAEPGLLPWLGELCDAVAETSACGLGREAPRRALSVLQRFPDHVDDHLNDMECAQCRDEFT